MAAQYTFFGTTQATCKVWDADAGGFPANWEQPGFDDSAWPLSVVPFGAAAFLSTSDYPAEGIEGVAPWTTPPTSKSAFLFRFHFTAPSSPTWTHYQWDFQFPGGNMAVGSQILFYINGIGFNTQNLPVNQAANYNYGADNVIAGILAPDIGTPGSGWTTEAWVALRQTFYVPTIGSQAYAWGTVTAGVNDKGFLGVGDVASHLTPTACVGLPGNVARIVSNGKTTLFLTSDGSLWGCGDNSTGLLGIGTTDTSVHATPVLLFSGASNPIADVTIGQDCALYATSNGDVRGWGPNASGSLGTGDTLPRYSSVGLGNGGTVLYPGRISAGKNFSLFATGLSVSSIGDNTYGQLGQGTSGAPVLTAGLMVATNFPATAIRQVSAGDDQTLILFADGSLLVCGRAEYGSLGAAAYAVGTGANKIVSTPIDSGFVNDVVHVEQAGPLSFLATDRFARETVVFGDGVPFGGSGDWGFDGSTFDHSPPTEIYGTTGLQTGDVVLPPLPDFLWNIDGLAVSSGGSQNPYALGNSKAVFAAFGFHPNSDFFNPDGDGTDGKLYTWGWGGAGQMGSGADATTNTAPISVNGLSDVIGAAVCAAAMFAISAIGVTARRARGFAAVVGD